MAAALPVIGAIGAIVGAAAGAVGTGLSIDAQTKQANQQARVAENNALLARYQQADVKRRAAFEANKALLAGRRTSEYAVTALSTGAADPTSGSMSNLPGVSLMQSAVDAERIRTNAVRAAWGLESEVQDYQARAQSIREAGVIGSIGTGLAGLGRLASEAGDIAGHIKRIWD